MYRVLTVDDEEPVLDSYEFMLKGDADFELAGKARSGFEAVRLIHEIEPDLVFMDINIPGIDGLEVIADVYKKFPHTVFVLSTAYERFDLAQRAIPLGVFAYLVKPVSRKTFLATLDTVREALKNRALPEAPSAAVDTAETPPPLQHFMRLTIWKAINEADWEKIREDLSLPSDKGIVAILETGEPENCPLLAEQISFKYHCRYDVMLNRCLFLISGETDRKELEDQLTRIIAKIIPNQNENGGFWGLGSLYRGPQLYLSCAEALRDMEAKRRQAGDSPRSRERQRVIKLRRKIITAPPEEVRKYFSLLWSDIFAMHDFTTAKAKMLAIFMLILDDIYGYYKGGEETPPPFDAAEIMALKDLGAWEKWSSAAFEKLLKEAALRRSGNFPPPLVKAIAYIQEHYADPLLQLNSAAQAALVSPAYLSRLFSERLSSSFVDYLTEFRVEKSEKLICESGINIKDAAFAVGYQDPNYFSKIFRRLRGLSPSEFAEAKAKTET